MEAEAAAFYALRGLEPERIINGSETEKLFYIAAMRKEQEREIKMGLV